MAIFIWVGRHSYFADILPCCSTALQSQLEAINRHGLYLRETHDLNLD